MKKGSWVPVLVGILLVLALSACGGETGTEATATALAAAASDSPLETRESESEKLGDWVEQSGLAMVAWAVEDPAVPDTKNYQPKPGTRLVAVHFELGCLSETHHAVPHQAQLIDSRGTKYDAVYGAMAEHPEFESAPLAMGERADGWLAFELPEDAVPEVLEYNPNIWRRQIELQVSLTE